MPHALARLFDPRGVAVVGASETPGKYGYILLKTLLDQGYPGPVYGINPRGGALDGREFVPSLDDVEDEVDVVLVVRPAAECPEAVAAAARRGIPFTIVYAAGFAEAGDDGAWLQAAMLTAAGGRTRLVGPNGMNVFSAAARLNLSAIVPFPAGELGFLSASGNLGFALAQEAAQRGSVGFSRFVSVGNQADLALDDFLDFLRQDGATRAVLVYLEGFAQGRGVAFLECLRRTAAEKPVLVLRGGRTQAGEKAARSHTAALAGDGFALDQALEQAGAVLVERADEALSLAQAILESPLPAGRRIVLVGEGGGHATLLADAAALAGLRVEPLPDDLVERLRPGLPPFAAIVRNPVEMGGMSEYDLRVYERTLAPIFAWDGCDIVLLFGGYALYDEALAGFLADGRRATGKPVLVHDLYASEAREALGRLRARGLPVFASVEVAARAAGALARAAAGRARAGRGLAAGGLGELPPLPDELASALATARARADGALTEDEAARLLRHAGIETPPAGLASSPGEAVAVAERIGFPVALKIHGVGFLHKTELGGVHLGLDSGERVRRAYAEASRLVPHGRAQVRITPFLPGGVEVIVGARRDPQLGPLLLFGAGGVLAELIREVAVRTLPAAREELAEMVEATRAGALLGGARGRAAADAGAVVAALLALGRLLLARPELSDVEVNPLRCAADGAVALDARVLVSR
ncbi:MAG TPA: acetate--CoA ligase family protein [Vicinamibacteria bacterium]|nr:acetate--CoA ligase family protein [Vicinamibacteria bacterium]